MASFALEMLTAVMIRCVLKASSMELRGLRKINRKPVVSQEGVCASLKDVLMMQSQYCTFTCQSPQFSCEIDVHMFHTKKTQNLTLTSCPSFPLSKTSAPESGIVQVSEFLRIGAAAPLCYYSSISTLKIFTLPVEWTSQN